MTLFDHLNNVLEKKPEWSKLTEAETKTWDTYMINRFLSMLGPNECSLVDMFQKHYKTDPKIVYKFYKSYFPKAKRFPKYIKGGAKNKINMDLVKILSELYECSTREAIEYLDVLSDQQLTDILEDLGYDKKEIKKLTK